MKRSGKIQKYLRDQVQSKHSYENWFNPSWWNIPCVFYTFSTFTQSMSKLFLIKYDEHFTWNVRKRHKTTANQRGNTVTAATCVCKLCLHHWLSYVLNVHFRGALKQFPWLMSVMNKQMWTKYKYSKCTSEKTFTEEKCQTQVTNSFHIFRKGKYVQGHIAAWSHWQCYPHCFKGEWKLELFLL